MQCSKVNDALLNQARKRFQDSCQMVKNVISHNKQQYWYSGLQPLQVTTFGQTRPLEFPSFYTRQIQRNQIHFMKLRNALWKRNQYHIPDQHITTGAIIHSSSYKKALCVQNKSLSVQSVLCTQYSWCAIVKEAWSFKPDEAAEMRVTVIITYTD